MTIVHSEAPWGQPQEEKLAPKERTHPMRALSRNNNTTTRLKRGPNPLSGVVILVLIFFFLAYFFWFILFIFFCLYFIIFFVFFLDFWIFGFFYLYFFIYLLFLYVFFFVFVFCCCCFFYFYFCFISALICCSLGDNHNRPSSPQATEKS